MRLHRTFTILLISLVMLFQTPAYAQAAKIPPSYPWGSVNYWWDCINDMEIENISVEFKVLSPLREGQFIYIAPIGWAEIGKTAFYGGIQTDSGGWRSMTDRRRINFGRGGIFSRWARDNKPIPLENAAGTPETRFEAALYEGSFISVRRRIPWIESHYKYEVRKLGNDSSKSNNWFGAFITDLNTGVETEIGRLRFDNQDLVVNKGVAQFVEIYGGNGRGFPEIVVAFKAPKLNGNDCRSSSVYAVYPKNGHEPHVRYTTTVVEGDWVVSRTRPQPYTGVLKDERIPVN
jgi:hypothetical protein